jgi:hypothetical protein
MGVFVRVCRFTYREQRLPLKRDSHPSFIIMIWATEIPHEIDSGVCSFGGPSGIPSRPPSWVRPVAQGIGRFQNNPRNLCGSAHPAAALSQSLWEPVGDSGRLWLGENLGPLGSLREPVTTVRKPHETQNRVQYRT